MLASYLEPAQRELTALKDYQLISTVLFREASFPAGQRSRYKVSVTHVGHLFHCKLFCTFYSFEEPYI